MSTALTKLLKGNSPLGCYWQTWSGAWSSSSSTMDLAQISSPINVVFLSFAQPNCTYVSGSNTWSGTGLNFSSDFSVVKGAIQILQQRGVVVILSCGGATYSWDTYNVAGLAALVADLGVNGIDLDWEPAGGTSASGQLGPIISALRTGLPNSLLSLAGFSVGAYGQGAYANATPASGNTGMCIPGLVSNGSQLDFICLMSYDASPAYDATVGFASYRSYFSGPILIGSELSQESWGGHVITLEEVTSYAKFVQKDSKSNGLFVWSYQKVPAPGTPSCMDIINTAASIFGAPVPMPTPTPTPTPLPTPVPTPVPTPTPGISTFNVSFTIDSTGTITNMKCIKQSVTPVPMPTPTPTPVPTPSPVPSPVPTPIGISNWQIGTAYNIGQEAVYNGVTYKCLQAHTAEPGWTPDVVAALWSKV